MRSVDDRRGVTHPLGGVARFDFVGHGAEILARAYGKAGVDQFGVSGEGYIEAGRAAGGKREAAGLGVRIGARGKRHDQPESQGPGRESRRRPTDTRTTHTPQPAKDSPSRGRDLTRPAPASLWTLRVAPMLPPGKARCPDLARNSSRQREAFIEGGERHGDIGLGHFKHAGPVDELEGPFARLVAAENLGRRARLVQHDVAP